MNMYLSEAMTELKRLRDISVTLNELDFTQESDVELLESLQREQGEIRALLNPSMSELRQHEEVLQLLEQCVELELLLSSKIQKCQEFAQEQIHRFQVGTRSKNAYGNSFYQTEGYFIDSKK